MEHIEYERRFLVPDSAFLIKEGHGFTVMTQAYLHIQDGWLVRVRRMFSLQQDDNLVELRSQFGFKGPRVGGARPEAEWDVRSDWIAALFRTAPYKVFKRRFHIATQHGPCDVDVFFFDNEGLVIAEFESLSAQATFMPPDWCGREITNDLRYNNENLAIRPYSQWSPSERY